MLKRHVFGQIIFIVSCCLLCQPATAQVNSNFTLNDSLYEFNVTRLDSMHKKFSVALVPAAGSASPEESVALLNTVEADDFGNQFDVVMKNVVGTYNPNDPKIKAEIVPLKIKLFTRFQQAFKPETKPETSLDRYKAIFNDKTEFKPLGQFILRSTGTTIRNAKTGDVPAKIQDVSINLANGSIAKRGLKITLDDGRTFSNHRAPVNLYNFYRRTGDRLYEDDSRTGNYICVGDVIKYDKFGKFYYPSDSDSILLNSAHMHDTVRIASSINQLLDVNIYTDLLALLGRKPNGILQTEVSGSFISNSNNLRNCDIVFHNFVRPYFRLSKFDSRFANLDSSKIRFGGNGVKDSVNRTYLNQIAYLQAGIKTNLVRFGIGNNQQLYINAGLDINLVNADSLYKKDISFVNYYPELQYTINGRKNWEFSIFGKVLFQKLTGDAPFANKETNHIISFQPVIYFYPLGNPDNKVYLRFNYFNNIDHREYNFSQFQFGWKTSLLGQKAPL